MVDIAQLVECQIVTLAVESSNLSIYPVTRQKPLRGVTIFTNSIKIIKKKGANLVWRTSIKCKSVNQYDKNNNFIQNYYSCGEAARQLLLQNISQAKIGTITNKITDCCRGERKSAYGFYWRFN